MAAPRTILVVDDDHHITDLIGGFLRLNGYRAQVASDGDQALQAVAEELPDLILLDLMLPKKDGFVVLEALRRDSRTKAVPVFIISAKDVVSDVDSAFAKGADEFIIKPVNTERLLAKIKKHLAPRTT